MEVACTIFGVVAPIGGMFLLIYLLRTTPRNEGKLHGGGLEKSSPAWGYPPLDEPDSKDQQTDRESEK